jgi:hypothetical protein
MNRFLICLVPLVFAACGEKTDIASTPGVASPAAAPPATYSATPPAGVELPPSQTTPGPIPLEFRHVWAIDPLDCTKEPGLTRIAIAPGAVKFYEGRSEVVSASSPHDGALVMEVKHSAEGQTTRETHTLALDKVNDKLAYQRRGDSFTYSRCE